MASSDEEYIQDLSSDEATPHQTTRGANTRTSDLGNRAGAFNLDVDRTWENLPEDEHGQIRIEALQAKQRKRTLKDTTPLQRGIIRHLILIIDLSSAMSEKDLRPTRYLLTIRYTSEFVTEFFEQNPISQLGIIGMRDGLAVRVSDMGGNPSEHIAKLQGLREQEPKGHASLQNALEMGRAALFHAPSHGTRELLLLLGSLLSSDPGDIHTTISALATAHITCTVIGLAAQVAICRTLVARTNPSVPASQAYTVPLDDRHYRELLMRATTPPATPSSSTSTDSRTAAEEETNKSALLMMGFPSRITDIGPTLCACHSQPTRGGYLCSRCGSKVCALPTSCPACGLTLILSTHLARSYHHLFPLRNWKTVSWERVATADENQDSCFGCLSPFPAFPSLYTAQKSRDPHPGKRERGSFSAAAAGKSGRRKGQEVEEKEKENNVSESSRYECETCHRFFCIDCDVFAHEVVHNCPGCQSREGALLADAG